MPGLKSPSMATSSRPSAEGAIAPATRMGTVHLTVSDLARSRAFYEDTLGLQASEREGGGLAFGIGPGRALVELRGDRSAPALNRRAEGRFYLAVLRPRATGRRPAPDGDPAPRSAQPRRRTLGSQRPGVTGAGRDDDRPRSP